MSPDIDMALAQAYEAARARLSIRAAIRAAAAPLGLEPHAAALALGFPAEFGDAPPADEAPEDDEPPRRQTLDDIRHEVRQERAREQRDPRDRY